METCENCGKEIAGAKLTVHNNHVLCPPCYRAYNPAQIVVVEKKVATPVKPIAPPQIKIEITPKCLLCGNSMVKKNHGAGGFVLFLLGLVLTPLVPIIGVLFIIVAIARALVGRRVLKCIACGAIVPCE